MSFARTLLQNLASTLRHRGWSNHGSATRLPLLSRTEILELRNRLEQPIGENEHTREVAHRLYGDAQSVYRGSGLDYEESRPYQTGDELRFMNWRLSARTGELYMKVFREERRPGVFILVDRRASMRFGTQTRLKACQAARATALIAFAAQKNNAPVAGVILDPDTKWLTESAGETGMFNLVNAAASPCPPLADATIAADLDHTIRLLQGLITRGSIVYLISDFHDLTELSRASLLQLATEHRVCAIRISDPAEKHLPTAGPLGFISGHSEITNIDTNDSEIQSRYTDLMSDFTTRLQQLFSASDIPCIELSDVEDDIETVIPLP